MPKAKSLCTNFEFVQCLNYTFPNENELIAMAETLIGSEFKESCNSDDDEYKTIKDAASVLLSNMQNNAHVVVTLGERGIILASKTGKSSPEFKHFPAEVVSTVKSTNGAGDTLCGTFIHALLQGATIEEAIRFGMKASILSLEYSKGAISPRISTLQYNEE